MTLRWIAFVFGVMSWNCGIMYLAAETPAYVIEAPDILKIEATGLRKDLPKLASDDYLVRPDGTINLGSYGSVNVSGLTIVQARTAISKHLTKFAKKKRTVEVQVEVSGYNSKHYYLVRPGKDGEVVTRFRLTGNETVLDAMSQIDDLSALGSKVRVEVVRDGKTLEVNWPAITRKGQMATNYEIMPGDVVRVAGHTK
jgi:polysaccharide biosynthesis/export protein